LSDWFIKISNVSLKQLRQHVFVECFQVYSDLPSGVEVQGAIEFSDEGTCLGEVGAFFSDLSGGHVPASIPKFSNSRLVENVN